MVYGSLIVLLLLSLLLKTKTIVFTTTITFTHDIKTNIEDEGDNDARLPWKTIQ